MSRTANDETTDADRDWLGARNNLFRMIMEGRSFSGRERNCCFLNTRDGHFASVSALSGIDFPDDGRALVITDWDQDGDLDLWLTNRNAPRIRYLENTTDAARQSLALRLVGDGKQTNRDAIGARVEVFVQSVEHGSDIGGTVTPSGNKAASNPERLVQTLRAGEGFLSQSSKWIHFGLGNAVAIERVTVSWPGGGTETFAGLEVGQRYELRQNSGQAQPVARIAQPAPSTAALTELPPATRTGRVSLLYRVPMPAVDYQPADRPRQRYNFDKGRSTLVLLWASWCVPCVQELALLADQREQLEAAGIDVLALNVDLLSNEQSSLDDAREVTKRLQLPFLWGTLDALQMTLLQQLNDQFFFLKRPLPLPASFLVDTSGRLAAIYKGQVPLDQLLADARRVPGDYAERSRSAACLPGRPLDHARILAVAHRDELQTRYRVAAWLAESNRPDEALRCFEELAQADPNWALPLRHIAKLQLTANQLAAARQAAERAYALEPDNAAILNTLGLIRSADHDPTGAEQLLREAVERDPTFAEAYNNLGTTLATQSRIGSARDAFARAVAIDPNFVQARTNLGSAYAALNEIPRAIKEYEEVVRIDPTYVDAYNNLGTMHARLGNYRQAIKYYQEVLRLDPRHPDADRNLKLAVKLLNQKP